MLLHEVNLFNRAGKNFFRLAVILYLAFLLLPNQIKLLHVISAAEYGIGGGVVYEENIDIIDLDDNDFDLELIESYEIAEPEIAYKSRALFYDTHLVQRGENISELAVNFGLNQDTIISTNKITNTRLLQTGRTLIIPNQDGILHTVGRNETISSIADRYKVAEEDIIIVNDLFSDKISAGADLFIPGAKMDWVTLQEINGDLFIWPVHGGISSPYGYRRDPFNPSVRQFHTGLDIGAHHGTAVRAAMGGRVSQVGYDGVLGNYVIINHHSGYRTLYAHLSAITTRTGAYVGTGERIGNVGSTGLSTGPHLHFTVYKNGVTVNPRSLMR